MSRKELTDTDIRYSIIIESNRFAFSASTAELKKNTLAKKNAEKGLNFELKRWQDKDSRIREASRGICAYTGAKLGDVVEYDHIIPRAFTTSAMGSVFNSEANLICVSRPGNQTKADKRYGLNKLHKTYLTAVFGTADVTTIAASIEDIVGKLASANRLRHFELLNEKEQDAVRHALFLDDESDARRIVLRELAAQNKSRVNGTQAWFVRAFMTKLLETTKDWRERTGNTLDIRSWKTDAEVASRLRSALAAINPVFTKTHPQPVASHSVDAMCAYAAACGLSVACSHLGADENFADAETYADGESLLTLHPHALLPFSRGRIPQICPWWAAGLQFGPLWPPSPPKDGLVWSPSRFGRPGSPSIGLLPRGLWPSALSPMEGELRGHPGSGSLSALPRPPEAAALAPTRK